MTAKYIVLCIVVVGACISVSFFQQKEAVPVQPGLHPAVQKTIDERVDRYRQRLLKECKLRVIEAATVRVDSIIIANAKRIKAVKVNRPPKPVRPRENGREVSFDTTTVEPLWSLDSLLYEQLLRTQEASPMMPSDSLLLDSLRKDSLASG